MLILLNIARPWPIRSLTSVSEGSSRPHYSAGSDPDGDALIYLISFPLHGVLTGRRPTWFYHADPGYLDRTVFEFEVTEAASIPIWPR